MSRCKETSGVLFSHPCKEQATGKCIRCQRPVCDRHLRTEQSRTFCVSCLRNDLRDRNARGSRAFLRDDPYFYWYFHDDGWFDDPYHEQDYSLFDAGAGAAALAGDESFDGAWEGS